MSNVPEASAPPQLLTQAGVAAAFFWWPRLFARRLLRGLVYALFLLSLAVNVVAARWVDLRPEAGKQFARAMEVEDAVVYAGPLLKRVQRGLT